MFKRLVSIGMLIIMCVSLVACGGSEKESEPITVAIWDSNQQPGLQEILDDFTEETGIEAEINVIPWDEYWNLLDAGARGGDLPDVFWMHSNFSQMYMSNDILLDLTEKIEGSELISLENYYEDITGFYQHNDKTYAVPKDYDTIALWYNKTMFDEAGLAYPDETWTWDTLAENAQKLTKEDGSQYGFVSPASFTQDGYYNLIYDMGGYIINDEKTASGWDVPETIEAMEWFYDNLVSKCMPKQEVMSENPPDILFQSGKAAMIMQGSWMVGGFAGNEYTSENCDIAVLPKANDGKRISIYNGLGWAANANTERPDDAWKVIEYLGSEKAQRKQAELGVTMSAFKGTSEDWVTCAPQFNLKAYLDMTEDMVIRPYSKTTKMWEDYSQQTMVKAYTGEMTMEQACKDIADYMNELLAGEKE